jgi:hypothetical protein
MILNEWVRISKKAVEVYLKILLGHSSGQNEENYEDPHKG